MGVQFCERRLYRSTPSLVDGAAPASAASGAEAAIWIIWRRVIGNPPDFARAFRTRAQEVYNAGALARPYRSLTVAARSASGRAPACETKAAAPSYDALS